MLKIFFLSRDDPSVFHDEDDALRKQCEQMVGAVLFAGQKRPEGTKQECRLDLLGNDTSNQISLHFLKTTTMYYARTERPERMKQECRMVFIGEWMTQAIKHLFAFPGDDDNVLRSANAGSWMGPYHTELFSSNSIVSRRPKCIEQKKIVPRVDDFVILMQDVQLSASQHASTSTIER